MQSASDTFDNMERSFIDQEYQQLLSEFDRIAQTTRFGSTKLLSGDARTFEFQVGSYGTDNDKIKYESDANTTARQLDLDGSTVDDKYDARDLLETIDTALTKIAGQRSKFGAVQSRLESVTNNSQVQIENLEAARSRIADTDVARAASEFMKHQVLAQYQAAVLAQANQIPAYALKMLG